MAHVRLLKIEVEGYQSPIEVTTSLGISNSVSKLDSLSIMLKRADIALLQAKHQERNRSCVFQPQNTAKDEESHKRAWIELAD